MIASAGVVAVDVAVEAAVVVAAAAAAVCMDLLADCESNLPDHKSQEYENEVYLLEHIARPWVVDVDV